MSSVNRPGLVAERINFSQRLVSRLIGGEDIIYLDQVSKNYWLNTDMSKHFTLLIVYLNVRVYFIYGKAQNLSAGCPNKE